MAKRNRQYAVSQFFFDHDHEIIPLEGFPTQQANLPPSGTPGIAPTSDDVTPLLEMLRDGCYLKLAPESDLPLVLLRSHRDVAPWGSGYRQINPGPTARQLRITKQGVWCPPMREPMLLAPTLRFLAYRNRLDTAQGLNSLTSIGGYCTNVSDPFDWLRWQAIIEASLKPFAPATTSTLWRFRLKKSLVASFELNDFTVYTPALPYLASARVPVETAAGNKVQEYVCSVTGNITHGYLHQLAYFGMANPIGITLQSNVNGPIIGTRLHTFRFPHDQSLTQWFRLGIRAKWDVTGGVFQPGFFAIRT